MVEVSTQLTSYLPGGRCLVLAAAASHADCSALPTPAAHSVQGNCTADWPCLLRDVHHAALLVAEPCMAVARVVLIF